MIIVTNAFLHFTVLSIEYQAVTGIFNSLRNLIRGEEKIGKKGKRKPCKKKIATFNDRFLLGV